MHKVLSYLHHVAHFNKTKNKGGVIISQNNNWIKDSKWDF